MHHHAGPRSSCAGCTSSQSPSANPTSIPQAPSAGPDSITIKNFAFSPATLTIKSGTTVTWTNQDGPVHQIASYTGSSVSFESVGYLPGDLTSSRLPPGTYPYHLTIHPSMTGNHCAVLKSANFFYCPERLLHLFVKTFKEKSTMEKMTRPGSYQPKNHAIARKAWIRAMAIVSRARLTCQVNGTLPFPFMTRNPTVAVLIRQRNTMMPAMMINGSVIHANSATYNRHVPCLYTFHGLFPSLPCQVLLREERGFPVLPRTRD